MPESNTDPQNKYYKNRIAEEKWKEEFYLKTVSELKTEERYITYFKQFDPASVDTFIKDYATRKVKWFSAGESLKSWEQSKSKKWIKDCFVALIEIQQKKLFNAQCLWRAEKVQLPGIAICFDFRYWEEHIFACQAIAPVTEEDIELYSRYLRETPLIEPFGQWKNFQDYDEMALMKHEPGNVFEDNSWYMYYDDKVGTRWYFDLPDLRGAKEDVYIDLFHKNQAQKRSQEIETQKTSQDTRPYFSRYDGEFMHDFVKRHEMPAFNRLFLLDERNLQRYQFNEHPEYCISLLDEIPLDYLAIEPAEDWRTAVACTYERYRREKVIELLPQAFALYLKHLGNDWNYPGRSTFTEIKVDPDKGLSVHFLKMILEGRILNGEPADLNF